MLSSLFYLVLLIAVLMFYCKSIFILGRHLAGLVAKTYLPITSSLLLFLDEGFISDCIAEKYKSQEIDGNLNKSCFLQEVK